MTVTLVWVFKVLVAGQLMAVQGTDIFLSYEECAEALDVAIFEPAPAGPVICYAQTGIVFEVKPEKRI